MMNFTLAFVHPKTSKDGSIFAYKDINENAELTGSDILLNKKEKGPDISSASTNSVPQKQDLSTPSEKKYDLKKKNAEGKEEVSESFKNAVARMYEKETKQAQNTAEAYKEGNKILNRKLEESRAETERYLYENR